MHFRLAVLVLRAEMRRVWPTATAPAGKGPCCRRGSGRVAACAAAHATQTPPSPSSIVSACYGGAAGELGKDSSGVPIHLKVRLQQGSVFTACQQHVRLGGTRAFPGSA